MCLIALALNPTEDLSLVVIANRDEWLKRPTAPLHRWTDGSGIVAGVDLEAGGTWMGIHPSTRRIAMVTNVRDPADLRPKEPGEPSRGALVRDFLSGTRSASDYVKEMRESAMRGFNLIAIDRHGAFWCSNRGGEPTELPPGIHGVSNALLDTPWPKVVRAKARLDEVMRRGPSEAALLEILADDARADDPALPDTGVGLELERALSPIRVALPGYGTRCSTVLMVGPERVSILERTLAPGSVSDVRLEIALREPVA